MNDRHPSDGALLQRYAEARCEAAFEDLVRRHLGFVYATALRVVGNPQQAQDVSQAVFVALARQASELVGRATLSGWLHRTTRNLAVNVIRHETRRRHRERESVCMRAGDDCALEPEETWDAIAPKLDEAMESLSEMDRDTLCLRYFEQRSVREVAVVFGISEEAAQKRALRALDRLRELLNRRGIRALSTGGLASVLATQTLQAAPSGFALSVSGLATTMPLLERGGTGIYLLNTLSMTTMQKAGIGITLILALGTGIYEALDARSARAEVTRIRDERAGLARELQTLRRDGLEAQARLAFMEEDNQRLSQSLQELHALRGEVSRLRIASRTARGMASMEGEDRSSASDLDTTTRAWAQRVVSLKKWLSSRPEASIPELRLLSEADWLGVAKDHERLETELQFRKAMSQIRGVAERKVADELNRALRGFQQAQEGRMPTELNQLLPYLATPLDESVLSRWTMAHPSTIGGLGLTGDTMITQRAPVDDVFDRRFGIGANGYANTDFLTSLSGEVLDRVNRAYQAAHEGEWPDEISALLPFAKTAEEATVVRKFIDYNGMRN